MDGEQKTEELIIKNQETHNDISQESVGSSKQPNLLATHDMVKEWRKHYIGAHSVSSTNTYYNFIDNFVGYEIQIIQKTVDRFRLKHMNAPCSGALKNFFSFLVNHYDLSQEILNIRFETSKSTKKTPEKISYEDIKKIIDKIDEKIKDEKDDIRLYDKYLTITIYSLGLRISEALKLTYADIDWKEWLKDRAKQGSVSIKNTKRGKSRTLPMGSGLLNVLYDAHKDKNIEGIPIGSLIFNYGIDKYVSNKDIQKNNKQTLLESQHNYIIYAENRYRKILNRIGFEALGKKINPHKFRHAKAQDMLDNNVPIDTIKDFLGHESIVSTQIYAQASAEKLKRELGKYDSEKEGV